MRPTISLTMIVKDGEEDLPRCLGSAQGIFDEIVIGVDDRTRDATREIAHSFGARVFDFRWTWDFAAARNRVLEQAWGDFIFWADADDVIPPMTRAWLPWLFARLRVDQPVAVLLGWVLIWPPGPAGPEITPGCQIRLFPNRPDVRWQYAIHERLEPSLEAAGIPLVQRRDVPILHMGYRERAALRRKGERNLRCLMHALRVDPGDPYLLVLLAREAIAAGDHEGVIKLLLPCLAGGPAGKFQEDVYQKAAGLVGVARAYLCLGEVAPDALEPRQAGAVH
jgi:glycosyltransferase involved in cell wall biosynthesis